MGSRWKDQRSFTSFRMTKSVILSKAKNLKYHRIVYLLTGNDIKAHFKQYSTAFLDGEWVGLYSKPSEPV